MSDRPDDLATLDVVSLFSGVGGIDLAFERAGCTTRLLCEQDKHAAKVLARHFPDAPIHHDVKELTADDLRAAGARPESTVLAAGFPCQPFSVAGKRGGERDPRGTLFAHIHRLVLNFRPAWVVLENVPGLLSIDEGETARKILDLMVEAGYLVDLDILDAQHFGVPQRRRRVLVICHRADLGLSGKTTYSALNTATLLTESLLIFLDEARRQSPTDAPSSGSPRWSSVGGLMKRMKLLSPALEPDDLATLLATSLDVLRRSAHGHADSESPTAVRDGARRRTDMWLSDSRLEEDQSLSTESSWNSTLDALCDLVRSSTTSTRSSQTTGSTIFTCAQLLLTISEHIALSTSYAPNCWKAASSASTALKGYIDYARQASSSLFGDVGWSDDWFSFIEQAECAIQSLGCLGDSGAAPAQVLFDTESGGGCPAAGVTSGSVDPVTPPGSARIAGRDAVTFQKVVRSGARDADGNLPPEVWEQRDVAATLTAFDQGSRSVELVVGTLAGHHPRDDADSAGGGHPIPACVTGEVAHTLTAEGFDASEDGTGRGSPIVPSAAGVRRLTPLEWERLQGLPDGWTERGINGPQSDSQRYKQCGNGVAVPVFEWVARRLVAIEMESA